jgi:hypothetical protein
VRRLFLIGGSTDFLGLTKRAPGTIPTAGGLLRSLLARATRWVFHGLCRLVVLAWIGIFSPLIGLMNPQRLGRERDLVKTVPRPAGVFCNPRIQLGTTATGFG